jgi:DNA polymerase III subunit beta
MRATVNGRHFVQSVGTCGHVLPSRSGGGRRGELILRTVGSELQCSADNGTFAIAVSMDASVEHEGCISVPADILTGFASAVDDIEDVALNFDATSSELHLACASFDPRIRCRGDATPPVEVTTDDAAATVDLDAHQFLGGVRSIIFAASKDDHRPVFTGVLVSIESGSVELRATDGHRIAWRRLKGIASVGVNRSEIIPAATLDEALSAIDPSSQPKLTLSFDREGRRLQIGNDRIKVLSRLIDGTFPNIDQLRGLRGNSLITVSAHELSSKVRTTAVWARAGDHVIRIYAADSLTLTASTRDVGDIRTLVHAQCSGEHARVALNSQFVLDCCAAAPEATLEMQLIDDSSPATVRYQGSHDYEYVMMSIKLSDW